MSRELTQRQKQIIAHMMPFGTRVDDAIIRTADSYGTISVEVPSKKIVSRVRAVDPHTNVLSEKIVPLKFRFYIDRVGAFQYGQDQGREYFAMV